MLNRYSIWIGLPAFNEEKYIGRPTNPSLFFIARCNEFKESPPTKDWDGIYTLKSK